MPVEPVKFKIARLKARKEQLRNEYIELLNNVSMIDCGNSLINSREMVLLEFFINKLIDVEEKTRKIK